MNDYNALYDKYLMAGASSSENILIERQKDEFRRKAVKNPSYRKGVLRNGIPQDFVITRSDELDKAKLLTFPDETIEIGDMLQWEGLNWLVYEVRELTEWQKTAILWLCNFELKFQNGTSKILKKWAVIDSGVFSTTIKGDNQIQSGDKQFNMWITLDEDTNKLYVDKRIAVGYKYDKNYKKILDVYSITAVDFVSKNFGRNSHIAKISLRDASNYDSQTDSLDLMICDVCEVPPKEMVQVESLILGKNKARVGSVNEYTCEFYEDGNKVLGVTPKWNVIFEDNYPVLTKEKAGKLLVEIPKDDFYIGSSYSVELTDTANKYEKISMTVEVS